MDPTNLPSSNFDLPPVKLPEVEQPVAQPDQAPLAPGLAQNEAGPRPMTEQQNIEMSPVSAVAPPPQASSSAAPAAAASAGTVTPASNPNPSGVPAGGGSLSGGLAAADSDLIEQAWVKTAKAIIEQTREDPYKQNKEINKVKTEYVKKRYNKDIKLIDE